MTRPIRVIHTSRENSGALSRTAVSHIAFSVPDVADAENFYSRVLGMSRHESLPNGGVRMGWGIGHHVVDLHKGESMLLHYGFEVRDENGIEGLRSRLTRGNIPFADLDASFIDEADGNADGISVTDPDGTTVHFHSAVRRQGENAGDPGRRPLKFQHTTVGTADVSRMTNFFVNTVGFRLSDQLKDGNFCWLRSNKDHHTLAIVYVARPGVLDHYSYDLAEWEDFKTWCDRLTELDVPVTWGPGRHGPGNNLFVFFDDPAGNHIELSAEMEKFYDDRVEYSPRHWTPAPQTVNLWGGQTPSWRKTSESHI